MKKFYDRDGDLVIMGRDGLVLCLASDRSYIEMDDGYFDLQFPKHYRHPDLKPIALEELPLYISKTHKARKFLELFR
jgi:hypothetical protein